MIAVAGTVVVDLPVFPFGTLGAPGAVNWVERVEFHLGGVVANTGRVLNKLGVPVAVVGRIGKDAFGRMVNTEIASWADVAVLTQDDQLSTSASVVLIHPDGERTFVAAAGAAERFSAADFPTQRLHECGVRALNLGYVNHLPHLTEPSLGTLLRDLRQLGWLITLDVAFDPHSDWSRIGRLLSLTDVFCPNLQEATALTGHPDPGRAAAALLAAGVQQAVVIKLGAEGCHLRTREGVDLRLPGHDVAVVDTTGAGDAFTAGLLASWHRNRSWTSAARIANATGALAVTGFGASEGVTTWDAVCALAGLPS